MLTEFKTSAAALALAVFGGCMPALAAVPLRWNVETSRAQPATFDVYRGETLQISADLTSYGRPLDLAGAVALYCQTNGMGDAWWTVPAAAASNRIEAVLSPTNYPGGASSLNCFLGGPATSYRTAFRLRVLGSPGHAPNQLPLPAQSIDFASVTAMNAPWASAADATNAAEAVVARDALPRMYGEAECLTLRQPTVLYGTASATNAATFAADGMRFGRPGYTPALEIGLSTALAPVLRAYGHNGFDWIRDGSGNGLSYYYATKAEIPDIEQYVTWADASLQFASRADLPYSFASASSSSVTVTNGTTTTVTTSAGALAVNLAQMPDSTPGARDAVVYLVNSAECSVTIGSAIRVADGATWPTLAAGEWLISLTEIAPGTNFVAAIRLADPTAQ